MRHNYLVMTAMLQPDPYVVRRFFRRGIHWLRLLMILFNAAFRQGRHR